MRKGLSKKGVVPFLSSNEMRGMSAPVHDPSYDLAKRRSHSMEVFFAPRNIAVIGATEKEGSMGRSVLTNLLAGPFRKSVFPVNSRRTQVLGAPAYSSISVVPEKVDLAVIVTPAVTVPAIIGECARMGIRGAIILSAGFREIGEEGVKLEREVLERARRGNIRVIGPNCLGVMAPPSGMNATFASTPAKSGSVGFISQSGALCTAVLDWSLSEKVGFSAFISVGSMLDVGWGDLIQYLGDDPRTKSIVIYMESIGDARSFLSAAREVALSKPMIVIKAGRTEAAAKAAASHRGNLAGNDEVLDAAFRRCGVLRVKQIADLFYMAEVLSKQPRPLGPRLAILSNAGGPGVLATDSLIGSGGQLAELTTETLHSLNQILPSHWSRRNPVDILGDASPEVYGKSLEILSKDPGTDGLLVILTPQAMTDPTRTAGQMNAVGKNCHKALLASWMGGPSVENGKAILNAAGIPTFSHPDTAAHVFNYMWQYSSNLKSLYETPLPAVTMEEQVVHRSKVEKMIKAAREAKRTLLSEFESKQLLSACGIPVNETRLAVSEKEAVRAAHEMGYPVVLKLHSLTITHKSDVGGVQLNLSNATAVRKAWHAIERSVGEKAGKQHFMGVTVQPMLRSEGYEVIMGSSVDPQFGPVLLFGAGGMMVEVFKDRALGLPPLNTTLARRMMERTRIFQALQGMRGRKPVDFDLLAQLLVRFSFLVLEQPWIKEIDINPLLVSSSRMAALDARVVIHEPEIQEKDLPRPAIRPYPLQYVTPWKNGKGKRVTIRPILPEDEPLIVAFHRTLSDAGVYMRYFHLISLDHRIEHSRLTRICFNDYDREIALIAQGKNPLSGEPEVLGIGRLSRLHDRNEAEFAILIADQQQRCGLGTELMQRLLEVGRAEKLDRIVGNMLPSNLGMQQICRNTGFQLTQDPEEGTVKAEFIIRSDTKPPSNGSRGPRRRSRARFHEWEIAGKRG